jgi:diguanylate cyclase (GGDEF)-like protein
VLEGHIRAGRPCGLVFLDLNGFKRINDQQGHAAGDAVLQCVARR